MIALHLTGTALVATTCGRRVALEELELNYGVRALVQMGLDPEVARVFGFSNGERSKVISLAKRKRVIQ